MLLHRLVVRAALACLVLSVTPARAEWTGTEQPESIFGDGRSWKEAVGALDWTGCELLVIGSSRLGPLLRVFVGSNSGKILRHAPVPRMIVPRLAE